MIIIMMIFSNIRFILGTSFFYWYTRSKKYNVFFTLFLLVLVWQQKEVFKFYFCDYLFFFAYITLVVYFYIKS